MIRFLAPLSLSAIGIVSAVESLVKLDYSSYNGTALANGVSQWLGVRYAAPPVGDLRFAAPRDPVHNATVQQAKNHGLICLATGGSPASKTTSEDCLFLDVYAPTNATAASKLPVFFFIQGGGFNADSNPNLNGSGLIAAADMDMVVVNFNYRVGPWGFLASKEIQSGGSTNNGIKDQIKALQWVQKYIIQFGGNPEHVVVGGDSAGAASVTLLLTAHGGRDDKLFVGTAAESQSFATQWTVAESQWMYDNLVVRTECVVDDTLACLRGLSAESIQKVNFNTPFPRSQDAPLYMYGPTIDGDLILDYTYKLFADGKLIKVPTIFGDDTNGGTIFTPKSTSNLSQSDTFLKDQFPALTLAQLQKINSLYPKTNDTFPNSGPYWRQVSNAYQEIRYMCPGLLLSDTYTNNSLPSWNYRYNVEDAAQMAEGLGVPHTVEVNAIWGPENIYKGGVPESYFPGAANAAIVPVIQGYWTSFVRRLDPNVFRSRGAPVWEKWGDWRRLRFQTNGTVMEEVRGEMKARCQWLGSIGPSLRQ